VQGQAHPVSDHRNDPVLIEESQIDTHHIELLAYFCRNTGRARRGTARCSTNASFFTAAAWLTGR